VPKLHLSNEEPTLKVHPKLGHRIGKSSSDPLPGKNKKLLRTTNIICNTIVDRFRTVLIMYSPSVKGFGPTCDYTAPSKPTQ